MAWQEFWLQLSATKQINGDYPPKPFILAASGESDASKQRRLREQLLWADQNGVLSQALSWLTAIPTERWNIGSVEQWNIDSY
jgi:hypothetical protein